MLGKKIHLISVMSDVAGGNEWRTLSLFRLLGEHADITLWSMCPPHDAFRERAPVKQLRQTFLRFPLRGTFIFSGVYFGYGRWLHLAFPRRVVVICNTYNTSSSRLPERLQELSRLRTDPPVDLVYASEELKRKVGRPGVVEPSLIDMERFASPGPQSFPSDARVSFTIGRLSRDVPAKHHTPDVALYRRLLAAGCAVRIMGGTCLRSNMQAEMKQHPVRSKANVELLPTATEEASLFLKKLDCFYYRTDDDWFESFGRVVAEAMACGLPVVCHDRGGYTDFIEHGQNGFLFDTQEEAFDILMRLKEDRLLRASVGAAARQSMEALYAREQVEQIVDFYTQ